MFSEMRIRVKVRGVRVTRKSRTPVPRMGMMMAGWMSKSGKWGIG